MDPFATELYERAVQAADEHDQAVGRELDQIKAEYLTAMTFARLMNGLADGLDESAVHQRNPIPSSELFQHVTQNRPMTLADVADMLRNVVAEMGCDEKSLRELADCRVSGEWPGKDTL